MRTIVFDIEADGLLDTITQVWCVCTYVVETGEERQFGPSEIQDALLYLDTATTVVGHNIIGYDCVALWKTFGWKPKAKLVDTLVLSHLVYPDVQGGHSLEAWGERQLFPKTEHSDWSCWSQEMQDYCMNDVRLGARVYEVLRADMRGHDWSKAEWMEHEFAKLFASQTYRGVYVDVPHCKAFYKQLTAELKGLADKVEPLLPMRPGTKGQLRECTPPKKQFNKTGKPSKIAEKWFDTIECVENSKGFAEEEWWGTKYGERHQLPTPVDDDGNRIPLKTMFPMKLADQAALKTFLMDSGWVPTMWAFKKSPDKNGKLRVVRGDDGKPVPTQPMLHNKGTLCPNLYTINSTFEHVGLVVRWLTVRHRLGLCKGVLAELRPNNTVSATGIALGTPTSRVVHKKPVANIPKAEPDVVYGKECRKMFRARPGRVLVGVDASGLEFRCLAHRVNNADLTRAIIEGRKPSDNNYAGVDEIHTLVWKKSNGLLPSRAITKNCIYGMVYGASDEKLGQAAGALKGAADVGKKVRAIIATAIPGLAEFLPKVESAAKRGWIKALDGRKIEIRSKHAALNTLLQSDGSILVKWATVYADMQIRKHNLSIWQVIHMHDEVQYDCSRAHAKYAGPLFIKGLQVAAAKFGFRCPLEGEYKAGNSWDETH